MRLTPEPRAPNAQGQLEKVCSVNAKLKPSPTAGSGCFFFCYLLLFFAFFHASLPRFLSSVPLRHRFFAELTLVAPGTERKGPELIRVMLNRRETISGKCRSENSILQCQKASRHAGSCGSVFYLCVCALRMCSKGIKTHF